MLLFVFLLSSFLGRNGKNRLETVFANLRVGGGGNSAGGAVPRSQKAQTEASRNEGRTDRQGGERSEKGAERRAPDYWQERLLR